MNILKDFKYFRVQMAQQAASSHIQPMTDDVHRILCPYFPRLIRPGQVIGIDGVAAFRIDHQGLGPVYEKEIFGLGVQCPFVSVHHHFFALQPEQRDRDIVENSLFLLIEQSSLLGIDLPLHLISLCLGKGKLGNDRVGLIDGSGSRGSRRGSRGGVGHEQIDEEAGENEAEPQ